MWGIFHRILSVPQNTVMDLNNVMPVSGLHIDLDQLENEATPWITQHRSRLSFFLSFFLYLAWCFVEVRHTRQTLDQKEGEHKLTFSLNNGIDRLLHISHLFHLISLYIFSSSWEAGASVREENAGVCQWPHSHPSSRQKQMILWWWREGGCSWQSCRDLSRATTHRRQGHGEVSQETFRGAGCGTLAAGFGAAAMDAANVSVAAAVVAFVVVVGVVGVGGDGWAEGVFVRFSYSGLLARNSCLRKKLSFVKGGIADPVKQLHSNQSTNSPLAQTNTYRIPNSASDLNILPSHD
jgi:hypothetical protein